MSITTRNNENESALTISIAGRFDFNLLNNFRSSYSQIVNRKTSFIIDFRNTTSIDSSALGMLLNMKRNLNKNDGEIKIINSNKDVAKILKITHLNQQFNIQ